MDDFRLSEAKAMPIEQVVNMLGIQSLVRNGHELIGPCPACGGRDRFGVNLRKGVFLCRRCEAKGGTIDLVMLVQGLEFRAALDWLRGPSQELSPQERRKREADAARNRLRNEQRAAQQRLEAIRAAGEIWKNGSPAEGTAVRAYLSRRGIAPAMLPVIPKCIRFAPQLPYTVKAEKGWKVIHRGPAMLAAVQGPDGLLSAVHRTWLDLNQPNGKAVVTDPNTGEALPSKKVIGSKKGGAIRLSGPSHESPVMVMGEGIETTLSAMVSGVDAGAMFWAGVDLGNMAGRRVIRGEGMKFAGVPDLDDDEAFVPPACVQRLVYVMDGDSDPKLTRAKLEAGLRRAMVMRPGLQGQIASAPQGLDLNDVLMGKTDG
jgi:hypothetical protein